MLNKNDPLIGPVLEVMMRNNLERDVKNLVNEHFGIQDRKALPRERQPEWDAVYNLALSEGVDALKASMDAIRNDPTKINAAKEIASRPKVDSAGALKASMDAIRNDPTKINAAKEIASRPKVDSAGALKASMDAIRNAGQNAAKISSSKSEPVSKSSSSDPLKASMDAIRNKTAGQAPYVPSGAKKSSTPTTPNREEPAYNPDKTIKSKFKSFNIPKRKMTISKPKDYDPLSSIREGLHPNQQKLDEAKLSPEHKNIITKKLQQIHGRRGKVTFGPNGATWSDDIDRRTHDVTVDKSGKVKMDSSPYVESQVEEEKSFAALAPPYDEATQKDRLVGAGVLKKHPTQPGKHILAKEDVTSPSGMGIKGPDYAPAGTKPDYAVRKTVGPKSDLIKKPTMSSGNSTVTQTGKTSSSATKSTMKESNLQEKDVSKAQHRFFGLVRGIQKGKAHGSANAEKAAREMSAKSVRDYAKTSERGLPEKVSEALEGSQVKNQTQYGVRPGRVIGGAGRTDGTTYQSQAANSTSTPGYALPVPQAAATDNRKKGFQLSPSALAKPSGKTAQPYGLNIPAKLDPNSRLARKDAPNGPQAAAKARQAGVQRLAQAAKSTGTPGYALPASPAAKTGPSFERTGRSGSPSMAPKPAATAPKPTPKPVQAAKKPAAAAPVKNASTRGGTMSQSDANVLAKVRASGGQKLSKTLPSGRERLKFFAARNAERRGP